MQLFSQRKGLKPVSEIIQTDSMNDELRNSIWNCLDRLMWSVHGFLYHEYNHPEMFYFSRSLWANYFKYPVDTAPNISAKSLAEIRKYYFSCKWNEVYDFTEFSLNFLSGRRFGNMSTDESYKLVNSVLEKELSAYRFIENQLTDITSSQEIEMLQEVIQDTKFKGTSNHLQRALELYADRTNPDYRNSIKESISAVESMAKVVTGNTKATLSDALKEIEKKGNLHKALKDGFEKLYAYTSDSDGIRHAMLEESKLTAADARYFLLSCASFVNYLKSKI